jgi:hypothetical protein
MKTRFLFLTLLTSISILMITNRLAFAEPITGCVKRFTGIIFNVQIGTEPSRPCRFGAEQITWNTEGPQGEQGPPGNDGQDGEDGTPGADGALADKIVAFGRVDPDGTILYNGTGNFSVEKVAENPNTFHITINELMDCVESFIQPLQQYGHFPAGAMVATSLFPPFPTFARGLPTDLSNTPNPTCAPTIRKFEVVSPSLFHFQMFGDPFPAE